MRSCRVQLRELDTHPLTRYDISDYRLRVNDPIGHGKQQYQGCTHMRNVVYSSSRLVTLCLSLFKFPTGDKFLRSEVGQ
jgi:hypothetical protein